MVKSEIVRGAMPAGLGAVAIMVLIGCGSAPAAEPEAEGAAASAEVAIDVVAPAQLTPFEADSASELFIPGGAYRGTPDEYSYVEQEWIATGEVDGQPYTTVVFVRRPSDASAFSGTLVVEPLHATGAAPIWIYTSLYHMRSGHAWACVYSQKSAVDAHVKSFNPERYSSLDIWSEASADDREQVNAASTPILAQVGAALRTTGPLEDVNVQHVILAGHSQTGGVVTNYILDGHDAYRFADGSPIYDGLFPSGAPRAPFGPRDVPLVQTLSEGDISDPRRPGREDRAYRRPDSDEPGDRYRLYEIAGLPHMGTRHPPYNDASMWAGNPADSTSGDVPADGQMNSLPHGALFSMTLDHLIQWVVNDVTPPRADRIEVGPDGLFAKDEHGNSRGGLRTVQMDVPRLRYFPNPGTNEEGWPARGVVGLEEPLPTETLQEIYGSHEAYVEQFNARLDELVAAGWLLPEDADEMRAEAEAATF